MSTEFDERAETWDDDEEHHRRAEAAAALLREVIPLEATTRLLEYGAGTGLLAAALAGDVGSVVVSDPSAGMQAVLARKLEAGAFGTGQVLGLDLARDAVPDLEVDLIVALMSLHHVPELPPVLAGFARLLAVGGRVAIIDLEEEDGSFHDEGFEGHHGFARAGLTDALEAAGFAEVTFRPAPAVAKNDREYPLFLCTAVRTDR
ncbi:MAG: class I SAM-dependent DNA methyltransferase [Nitriliruptoraceae bacterium]